MRIRKLSLLLAYAVLVLFLLPCSSLAEKQLITFGTGGVTGNYYPTTIVLADLINGGRDAHGLRVAVETTPGSKLNIMHVAKKELDFGLVQSDVHYQVVKGVGIGAKTGPVKNLQSVFSLTQEPLHLVTRKGDNIKELADLKGKRVNLGNRGSGQRVTVELLLKSIGWSENDIEAAAYKSIEQADALCGGKVDAVAFTVATHSKALKELSEKCETVIVDISAPVIDAFVKAYPYYKKTVIPGGIYAGNPNDVNTFGVTTTLMTEETVPKDVVYRVVKYVFTNLDVLKKVSPAYGELDKKDMTSVGLIAPLHAGAKKYYKEAGLL